MSGPGSTVAASTIRDVGRLRAFLLCSELPTWLVAAAVYGGWLLLTLHAALLPWWIAAPALGCIIAWHNSLQHEVIHGHPTRHRAVNDALGMLPLGLWLPFHAYRRVHLDHHRVSRLTDPGADPESFYFTAGQWRRMPPAVRRLMIFNNTLLGRLSVGPAIVVARYWWTEIRASTGRDGRRVVREWWPHLALAAALMWWVTAACGMPLWVYLLAALIGLSLTLHRSFDEHRPAERRDAGSVTVDASPVLAPALSRQQLSRAASPPAGSYPGSVCGKPTAQERGRPVRTGERVRLSRLRRHLGTLPVPSQGHAGASRSPPNTHRAPL